MALFDARRVYFRTPRAKRHDHQLLHLPAALAKRGSESVAQLVIDRDLPVGEARLDEDRLGLPDDLVGRDVDPEIDREVIAVTDEREARRQQRAAMGRRGDALGAPLVERA